MSGIKTKAKTDRWNELSANYVPAVVTLFYKHYLILLALEDADTVINPFIDEETHLSLDNAQRG